MIISFGEALIDFLPRAIEDQDGYLPAVGGSPANVAVGIGRLGVASGFAGGLSTDFFGDLIAAHLRASEVDLRFSPQTAAGSTLAFVSLAEEEPQYAFFDENSANRLYTPPELEALLAESTGLHFGSFSLGVEPLGTKLEAVISGAGYRRFVSIDPNIRESLIEDEDAYRARLDRILPFASLVKISAADLEWLHPDMSHENVAQKWLADGSSLVVITRGSQGAIAYTQSESAEVSANKVDVVDTVGAGDSYMAGLLAYLAQNTDLKPGLGQDLTANTLREMLDFAGRCAAITVSRAGANPPFSSEL